MSIILTYNIRVQFWVQANPLFSPFYRVLFFEGGRLGHLCPKISWGICIHYSLDTFPFPGLELELGS
jgi:hypothetical protein